jgi:hypothetical protein
MILLFVLALMFLAFYLVAHYLIYVVLGVTFYLLFHIGHSRRHYRNNSHRSFLSRVWVSIPGPFHTRIGRRM